MLTLLITLALITACFILLSRQASIRVWLISYLAVAFLFIAYTQIGWLGKTLLLLPLIPLVIGSMYNLRAKLISKPILKIVSKAMPVMSSTEREALEAGTVSWEGDIFSGSPDFEKLLHAPVVHLTEEERAFIDGPLNTLCRMIDDWDITHKRLDLSPEVWQFIKDERFFGMIIPKEYGGLGFSATAQTMVLMRIYTVSGTVATTISVPNSLGPAELLLKYGTKEQREYYLPRLANGREIPCFALTGPTAGSDAASIPDTGVVCRQEFDGKEVLGIRLNWNKRYITLCPVATVIGLAFRLFDPDNLLGKGKDVGISCALIPANTPGVIRGRRHFPMNLAFMNGPTQGKNVFIPMDYLIGGATMAGAGWRMLMECLSAGRAISLPSSAAGGSQAAAFSSGAYSRIRKQFNQAIANFEGIEEPLARIMGNNYIITAGLGMTAAAIDHGAKPSVAGAILKYHTIERSRTTALDAMDIHGGKGICVGPKNYLARGYQSVPIGVTVEGANILTRSLIIYGQGAIRCHPYVFKEMESVRENNLADFDKAFWGHAGFILANFSKTLLFVFTDARFTKAPHSRVKCYYQLVHRYSTNLAFTSDFCMSLLGGELKRKEKISARLGDVLSNLYLASAVLKRYHDDGEPLDDLPVVEWCCQQLLHECEYALRGVITNFPIRWARTVLKLILQPFGGQRHKPSDRLGQRLAKLLSEPSEVRSKTTSAVFKEPSEHCPLGRLEQAFNKVYAALPLEKKIYKMTRAGQLHGLTMAEKINEAQALGAFTASEIQTLHDSNNAREEVIAVDDFSNDELHNTSETTETKTKKKITTSHDDFPLETA